MSSPEVISCSPVELPTTTTRMAEEAVAAPIRRVLLISAGASHSVALLCKLSSFSLSGDQLVGYWVLESLIKQDHGFY